MSDLISRKALLEDIDKYVQGTPLQEMFKTIVDKQPAVYDVDKVVEQLETYHEDDGFVKPFIPRHTVVEIVKGGGKHE